ncbi:hypothetical protein [Methylopila sp. M107]|uniref:hypothetical protein n=1 Tax=Methylopila sp. M107 TaxID=1101190 RepID=UPI00036D8FBB|nr:hypothetical protein [Methylopila sp. M107]
MTDLCLQVHPHRAPGLDLAALRAACGQVAASPIVSRYKEIAGEDGHPYVNFMFATETPGALWRALKDRLYGDHDLGPELSGAAMAMCEGDNGWDDYLLLAHYDPSVPLSEPPTR